MLIRDTRYKAVDYALWAHFLTLEPQTLTAEQVQALAIELAKPRYAGKTTEEKIALLNEPYEIDNPLAGQTIGYGVRTCGELADFLFPFYRARQTDCHLFWAKKIADELQTRRTNWVVWNDPEFAPMRALATTPDPEGTAPANRRYLLPLADLENFFGRQIAPLKITITAAEELFGPLAGITAGDIALAEEL